MRARERAKAARRAAVLAVLVVLAAPAAAHAQRDVGAVFTPLFSFGAEAGPNKLGEFPGDVAIDSDGNVWVVDDLNDRVLKFTVNGEFITAVGAPTLVDPRGIGADARGSVYVVDRNPAGNRVVRLTTGATPAGTIGATAPGSDGFLDSPDDVAAGPDGTLYVSDGQLERFRADGTPLPPLPGVVAGGSIAVAPDGTIATVDADVLQRTTATGAAAVPPTPLRPDFSGTPSGLAVDSAGDVYIGFVGDGEIGRFAARGGLVERIGRAPDGTQQLFTIARLAVDCRRNLYVTHTYVTGSPPVNEAAVVKLGDPEAKPPPCAPPPPPPGEVSTQVNDIEVTQGIQPERTFTARRELVGSLVPPSYDDAGYYGPTVPLVERRETIVRVFANLRAGPAGGLAGIPAALTVVQRVDGRTIRHAPILPVAAPAILRAGDATVDAAERAAPSGAYTFVLPTEWTRGTLTLEATVNPANQGCDRDCQVRSRFRLNDVPFTRPRLATVWPLALTVDGAQPTFGGARLDAPGPALDLARVLTPLPINLFPWLGRIEVGDIIRAGQIVETSCLFGIELDLICSEETKAADRQARQALIFERLARWIDDNNAPASVITLGLMSDAHPDLPGAMLGRLFDSGLQARGYVTDRRPTTVAHELQHALGRPHASQGCGATGQQAGEPWPPDERGLLQGVGLDPRRGSGRGRGPFALHFPGANAGPAQWFDLMSYCRGTTDAWISPKGWRDALAHGGVRARASASARARTTAAARSTDRSRAAVTGATRPSAGARVAQAARVLRVVAVEGANGRLTIGGVSPDTGPAEPGDPGSPFVLETRDASGREVLASSRMRAAPLVESGGTALTGQVPTAGAAMVVVRREGGAITRRMRSPNAPRVRLLAPRRGTRAGGTLVVRWTATDADGPGLTATVESSADGGRTWRVQHVGASRGRAAVPVRDLVPSRRARIRVRVDDGFTEAQAVSGIFTVPVAAPRVRILEPRSALSVRPEAPVVLRGEATAGGRRLTGRALRWFDGRKQIGTGETATLPQLAPGRHVVRVVASSAGRRAERSVRLTAPAVRARLLFLRAPARVGARARTVRLRVATTVPATVDGSRGRRRVGRRTRTVVLPVRLGARSVVLRLRTPAGITRVTVRFTRG